MDSHRPTVTRFGTSIDYNARPSTRLKVSKTVLARAGWDRRGCGEEGSWLPSWREMLSEFVFLLVFEGNVLTIVPPFTLGTVTRRVRHDSTAANPNPRDWTHHPSPANCQLSTTGARHLQIFRPPLSHEWLRLERDRRSFIEREKEEHEARKRKATSVEDQRCLQEPMVRTEGSLSGFEGGSLHPSPLNLPAHLAPQSSRVPAANPTHLRSQVHDPTR